MQASACNFIKNETLAQLFPCKFCTFSQSTSGRLCNKAFFLIILIQKGKLIVSELVTYFKVPDQELGPSRTYRLDTGHELNVHKTFRRRPRRLLNILCAFNLRSVSKGQLATPTLQEASNTRTINNSTIYFYKRFLQYIWNVDLSKRTAIF